MLGWSEYFAVVLVESVSRCDEWCGYSVGFIYMSYTTIQQVSRDNMKVHTIASIQSIVRL